MSAPSSERTVSPSPAAESDRPWLVNRAGGASVAVGQHWKKTRIFWLIAMVAAAAAFLLSELLIVNQRNPLIVIAPAPYDLPFSALPWSEENVAALKELDQETFSVADISDAWRTKSNGLRQLTAELQAAARRSRRPDEIVLYFRTHAAVDGNGVPCLVLPDASALRSETWLPLTEVFTRIRSHQFPDSVRKLVILDCSDVLVNWNHGVLFNTFAARVTSVARTAGIPNLVVVSAAGPGQIATSSPGLRQGLFAHFLRRGLGGEADLVTSSGNGDRRVSLHELLRYLKSNVENGSQLLSGRSQRVTVTPEDPEDFGVSVALNPWIERMIVARRDTESPKSTVVSPKEISELWTMFQRFQEQEAIRFEPKLWIDIAHRIVALESATESGSAYEKNARRLHSELLSFMAALDSRREQSQNSTALPDLWGKVAFEKPLPDSASMQFYSLRMSELFATIPASTIELTRSMLTQFKQNPTPRNLDELIKSVSAADGGKGLDDINFCQLLQRYNVLERSNSPSRIATIMELRELADQASVTDDERVLEWIREEVDRGDVYRRNAEDQLFAGTIDPSLNIAKARQYYNNAIEVAKRTKIAFQMRSQLAYEIPFLARWTTGISFAVDSSRLSSTELRTVLRQLIRNQIALERILSSPSILTLEETVALPFDGIVAKIRQDRNHLLSTLDDEYERFLQLDANESGSVIISDVVGLLSVPLLPRRNEKLGLGPAEQRSELREKLSRLNSRLYEQFRLTPVATLNSSDQPLTTAPDQSSNPLEDAEVRRTDKYLEGLLVGVPEHIALSILTNILSDEAPIPDDEDHRDLWAIADRQGGRFREVLVSVQDTVIRSIEEQMTSTMIETVLRRNLGAWVIRVMAASDAVPDFEEDPVSWRRRQDLVRFLVWHAQRAIDDFWGGSVSDGVPLFEKSVTDTLRAAESITIPMTDTRMRIKVIRSLLAKRKMAARRGLKTRADDLLLAEENEPTVMRVEVTRNPQDDVSLPEGSAVVFLRDGQGKPASDYVPLVLPVAENATKASPPALVEVGFAGGSVAGVKAVTLFRGHEFGSELPVNVSGGILIDYSPYASQPARVSVRGRERRKLSIVFILDCSASMQAELPLENNRGKASRLDIAKLALQQMFEKLADDSNRVGVMLFGHRLGWNLKQAGELLKQTSYAGPIPDYVRPYDDVETILPLGRFNASFAAAVNEQLASVKPWGESPLYLALIQALRQFHGEEDDSEKAIVVITDGMNYQFNPPPGVKKAVSDVVTSWSVDQVPIHIVGLGIAADQSQEALRVFGELARKSGGAYVSANEAQELIAKLESLRRPKTFKVIDSDGVEQTAELSQPVSVTPRGAKGNDFTVSFGATIETLSLKGGESVDLMPSRDERNFEVSGYGNRQTQFVPLVQGYSGDPTSLVVGVHRPSRQGNSVNFEFSIESTMRRFVPRPASVWIEVFPIGSPNAAAAQPYIFYDANYVPGTSVPVLKWRAEQWPATVNQARIGFWCKMQETVPAKIMALDHTTMPGRGRVFTCAEAPGISYSLNLRSENPFQALLVERHSSDSQGIAMMKVEFRSDSVIPSRVTHRFDPANDLATHRFQFPSAGPEAMKLGEIRLTTRQALMDGALSSPEAILVDVAESADVLEPRPGK